MEKPPVVIRVQIGFCEFPFVCMWGRFGLVHRHGGPWLCMHVRFWIEQKIIWVYACSAGGVITAVVITEVGRD